MSHLTALDWVVLALYGAVVVGIGVYVQRRQKNTDDYFLGGRRMPWWALGVSLIATSFSSAALIGVTGFGFRHGLSYLQLQLGDLVGIAIGVTLFLPFFASLGLTTAYEYLERRFGGAARTIASLLFIGQTLLRAGILVYGPALALSQVVDVDIETAILVTAAAAILYSAAGGIQAVVWTDLIQLAVVVFSVVFSLSLLGGDVDGGFAAIVDHANAAGRLDVGELRPNWKSVMNPVGSVFAYGALALAIAGTNQQAVQRYLSCKDLRSAQKAAFLGWSIGLGAIFLTLFLGVCLASWSELAPAGAAVASAVADTGSGDAALPAFVASRLPMGIAGLVVAAVFAASMSSMDSAIHSMSTAVIVDFVRPLRREPLSATSELRIARVTTAAFGVLAAAVAVIAAGERTEMIDLLLRWLVYFAGPLLGLFFVGVLWPRAGQGAALLGVLASGLMVLTAVVREWPANFEFHPLWLAPSSCSICVGVAVVASLLLGRPDASRTRGLTLLTRRDVPPPN